jgi:subtilase family serine protease
MPGNNGEPDTGNSQNAEIALDIEMVISMAPGLEKVLVLEGYTGVDVMNQLAYPSNGVPLANQASSSWDFSEGASYDSQLMEMAAQGQSFYLASGDSGAPASGIKSSSVDDNYATMVGGTELSMNGVGVSWQAETVWDYYYAGGASTGYIETDLAIPYYQHGINTTANGGSSTYRNVPDVAMCADEIEIVCTQWVSGSTYDKGQVFGVGGTSAAAPLWAAFTALVNQQAADQGRPSIGFLNPAVYSIAQGPLYTSCFHDVTVGNNIEPFEGNGEPSSGGLFTAGPGYDNCTGLGTPTGASLINALVNLGPTYVNFNYTGSTQNGTYFEPFKTLAGGVNAVISGGTIVIETAGSSSETMTITKPMNIIAQDGAATIGN